MKILQVKILFSKILISSFYYCRYLLMIILQIQLFKQEERLARKRQIKYKGAACIRLEALKFDREPDQKTLDKLKKRFQERCCYLRVRNYVCALISQQQLDVVLQASGLAPNQLLCSENQYQKLKFSSGIQLDSLHELYHIKAAKNMLSYSDK